MSSQEELKASGNEDKEVKKNEKDDKKEQKNKKDEKKPNEKKEEKESKNETSAPKEEGERKATELLNMLAFIAELQTKRRNVSVPLELLKAAGYGPCEWKFSIAEKVETRYRVISPGTRTSAIVVRDPIVPGSFDSIDSFVKHIFSCADKVIEKALILYREAETVSLDARLSTEPEQLGVPLSKMCEMEPEHENICATIGPFCATQRQRNPNYCTGRVAEGLDFGPLRECFFEISRDEMRPFRESVAAFEHYIRQSKPEEKGYRHLYPNDVLHVVANPFGLNRLFDFLPMTSHYCSDLIWEILSPELSVNPLSSTEILLNASQSMSRVTTLNAFAAINERPNMEVAIGYYMLSLLCPGSVNFMINLEDIPKEDSYLRLLAALGAKLLFSYNTNQRWNSITESSVREVESAIVRVGTSTGVLDSIPGLAAMVYPLDSVRPSARSQLEHFDLLRTNDEGSGWRESGGMRFGEADVTNPYVECQPRPLYVTPIDDLVGLNEELVAEHYAAWETKNGVIRLLSCLARGKVMRTPLSGTESVMDLCAHRLFRFFIAVNSYNRENWYTALRPTDGRANNLYDDEIDAPQCVSIDGRTILYIIKSLDERSLGPRKMPYLTQLHLECGLMRDCIETFAREDLLTKIAVTYGVDLTHFTSKERAELTHPKTGPLAKILNHIRASGYSSRIGNFSSIAEQLTLTDGYLMANQLVIENPLHFGISPSVILRPRIPRGRVEALRELSRLQRPYTNVFSPLVHGGDTNPAEEFRLDALQRMIVSYSAKENLRELSIEKPIRLALPAPFAIVTGSLSGAHEHPFSVAYQAINRHNTLRTAVKISKRSFCLIPIDADLLSRPDMYLSSASELESVYVPQEDFDACVETVTQWLANIHLHMNETRMICTKNIVFCSVFDKA